MYYWKIKRERYKGKQIPIIVFCKDKQVQSSVLLLRDWEPGIFDSLADQIEIEIEGINK